MPSAPIALSGTRLPDGLGAALPRPARIVAGAIAALLHGLLLLMLIAALAPGSDQRAATNTLAAITIRTIPLPATPARTSTGAPRKRAQGPVTSPVAPAAAPPPAALAVQVALPVASTGGDMTGRRTGTASGDGSGDGDDDGDGGGGGGGKLAKIAGEISSAHDYPLASRDLRIGDYVIIALSVGSNGRPSACRIHRASRDADADAVTCRLAMARFRFRPATDAAGQPVEAVYGWRQSWHY